MTNKEFGLNFYAKVKTDVSSVKQVVENLKTQLENLKLPAGATKNFEKSFEKLEGQIREFESLASNGVNSLADTKKVQAAWDKIAKSINGLGFSLKELDAINDQIFPKEVSENIKKANRALEEYQNKLKEIKDTEKYKTKKAQISEAEKEVTRTRTNYSSEQKRLANKRDEVTGLEKAWAPRAEEYEKQAEKVRKLNEEYQNLSNTLDKMRADKAALETIGAIDSTGKVSSKYKNLLSEKEDELADLEDEAKLREKNQKKQLEFEERIKAAQDKLRKATQYEKQSKTEEKKAKWIKEQAEAQAELNAAQDDSKNFTASIEARKEALREEINLMKERIALAEQVTQTQINEQSKKVAEKGKELRQEEENETFKDDKKLKKNLEAASSQLRTLETTSQSAKDALDAAEKAVEDLNDELNNIETDNAKNEWQEVVNTLKQFTDVNLDETKGDIEAVKKILEDYTADEIKKTPEILEKLRQAASGAEKPIRGVGKAADDTAEEFREMDRAARDMENLKDQVLDFFSISNTIQIFKNAIRDAFDTVKELDAAMTETAVVTDFSIGDMWDKLPEYSAEATKLGASIKSLYEATTLYYQQGLNSEQAMGVGIETMKMARIANMDAAAATKAMTAALRGFNMEINETSAIRINDVYSELAAVTAADTSQIATAMSKTASIAESANMEFETTAALLAQIIETTQEAPETAGTALKTIIARFTEVKQLFSEGMLTGKDSEGEEININKIDAALKTVGISLKDFLTGAKGIDDIFLELASKWDTLDLATQRYIATTAAGSRQQSRFLAMMGNYDRTMELVNAATNSAGASQKQFGKTLESLDAKLQKLKNAWDTFTMGLANNEAVKFGVDLITEILESVNNLTDNLGGLGSAFAKLAITITALKVGKNIFNSFFDPETVKKAPTLFKSATTIIQSSFQKIGVSAQEATAETLAFNAGAQKIASGMMVAGTAASLLANYFRAIGLEELAEGIEAVGGGFIVLGSILTVVNGAAQAMGLTFIELGIKIWTALAPILPIIIAVGVALGAVALVLKKIYDNSAAGKLKAAKKATEAAGEAAQDAAEAYSNLTNAINSIDDKTEALSELTRGTNEWREAVIALNSEILKLVETYPELAGFIENEGGVLKIDYEKTATNKYGEEQTANDILESYLRKQTETQQIYNRKQIDEKQAEIDLEYSKSMRDFADSLSFIDIEKAEKESETGSAWEDARKIVDKLSIEIAKGNLQTDETSIQNWLKEQNVQTRDFEEFDYSVFKTYGDYLLSQQTAIDGLTDATIAAQMAMMKLTNVSIEASEAVLNFDDDILREAYNKQLNEAKTRDITKDDYLAYAEEMGYTHERKWVNNELWGLGEYKDYYYDENGKKVNLKEADVRDFVVNRATNEDFTAVLQSIAEHFDNSNEQQQEMFSEIFANGVQELSLSTLSKYGAYQNEQFSFSQDTGIRDAFAQAMNFKNFEDMARVFEIGPEQLAEQIGEIFTEGGAEFIKVRKNLVKNMTKYSTGAQKDFDVNANLLTLLEAKYKDLDVASILTDVISKLELTGDEEFSTAAYESLRDIMMKADGAAEMQDALNFFNEIDFNNPIDALDTINNEIKNGTGYSRELAVAMKETNSSFLSASSQMSTLFNSVDFEDIKEDLDDIIEKNGEISAADVFDLTKSYKSLDKVLKNNKMTANGLAEILEQIADETVKVDELTDTVLAAMSSFESLDSIAAKSVKFFEDFDLGIDESVVGDTIVEWGDLILENMKKGAVGNSQNFRILDTLFPGWDEGIETAEARIAEMSRLGNLLKGNGQNLRKMWSDIYAGKDYKGNDISLSAENQKMGLSVRDTGEEIIFEGWEGKNLTSVDLVSWISDAYEVSTEMAEAMLTDFKNYSGDLADELRANDYAAGIKETYEALHQFGNLNLVDEREIETISKLLGVSAGTVRQDLIDRGATVTNFYDDKGEIKSFEEIQGFMDAQNAGLEAGKKWSDGFISSFGVGGSQGGKIAEALNLSDLEKELNKIGITGLNAEKLKEQAFNAMKEGLGSGAQAGVAQVTEVLANGDEVTVTITPEMSYEEYQQQVAKLTQQVENNALADAIGSSVAEAMNNIEITTQINENSLIEFRTQIEEAASQAQPEANVTLSEDSANTMRSNITEVAEEPHSSPVTISISNPNAINNLMGRKTVYVDIIVDKNEIPSNTGITTTHEGRSGKFATGIKNAPRDYNDSLVSEEGPELIQKADGDAYLSGTSGPEIVNIEKGDTVYTTEETKDIFKKRNHNVFPRYASGYGSGNAYLGTGSGGKGSGNSDDKEDWENPFDKLYNLVREIDEELRRRERLERRYEKLLESVDLTAGKLFDNAVEQLRQLEKEKLLNKELQEARRFQIQQYQQENADLMKYAKVVQNERGEDVLRINWDQIDLVEDPEQGERIEDYVSQLEEWFDSLEEAEDKLNDIEDRIEEVKELGKEEYLDFENAIKDAITFAYQEEIDKLSEINESINDTNSQLIDAISKQVNRIRQQRENERTEQELQEKQRQLLYLSQDTSGANDMAILELQREIEEGTIDYTDTLIDQKIDELQMQNDEAAEQREQQITLMQAQLDHLIKSGEIWDEVYTLMDEGLDPEAGLIRGSRLEQILKSAENFDGMSKVQQMDWLKELQQQAAQAVVYMRLTTEKIDTAVELNRQNHFGATTPEPEYSGSSSGGSGGGSGGGGSFGGSSTSGGNNEPISTWKIYTPGGSYITTYTGTQSQLDKNFPEISYKRILDSSSGGSNNNGSNNSGSGNNNNNNTSTPKYTKMIVKFADGTQVTYNYNSDWKSLADYHKKFHGGSYTTTPAYKTGGLADFTGPAWLDGTKSRPELVLNQKDTQNFIQLKDILASLMTGPQTSTENNGDITYDIDINVESIGSDYDVEQVANKIKSLINEDARYRNNNAVSLKR